VRFNLNSNGVIAEYVEDRKPDKGPAFSRTKPANTASCWKSYRYRWYRIDEPDYLLRRTDIDQTDNHAV
jgi:hypothetical protein